MEKNTINDSPLKFRYVGSKLQDLLAFRPDHLAISLEELRDEVRVQGHGTTSPGLDMRV